MKQKDAKAFKKAWLSLHTWIVFSDVFLSLSVSIRFEISKISDWYIDAYNPREYDNSICGLDEFTPEPFNLNFRLHVHQNKNFESDNLE